MPPETKPASRNTRAGGPGKRERNKAANRAAILEAAQACFLELGYEVTSIRDVIRRTNLAAGTFYNYFTDKQSLLQALVESHMRALTADLVARRRRAGSLEEFVHRAYVAAFTAVAADPVLHTLLIKNEHAIAGFAESGPLGMSTAALRADIADAIQRKLLPAIDVDALTAAFYGVGYELARLISEQPERCPEQTADFATRLFLRGLA